MSGNASDQGGTLRTVAIIGASSKTERYANKAQALLMERGYPVAPIAPAAGEVLGEKCFARLEDYPGKVDTVTLYVGPDRLAPLVEGIVAAGPRRVIFNPGTESPEAMAAFEAAGIACEEACTLVLLRTGQF